MKNAISLENMSKGLAFYVVFPEVKQIQLNPPPSQCHSAAPDGREGGRESEGSPANVEKRSQRAEREGVEVTLDTEVAFWYAPNRAMLSIQPSLSACLHFTDP